MAEGEGPKSSGKIPYWRMIVDQGVVTPQMIDYPYVGSGTTEDPYIVEWIENDPRNPMLFSNTLKWAYTGSVSFATFGVSLGSSCYAGGIEEVLSQFHIGNEVGTLGVSLYVLGFALGPLIWAPLSELLGRQFVYTLTMFALSVFCAGCAGAQNSWTVIILRFFAGSFGSSPLTNAGGTIADIFNAEKRGIGTSLFAGAPFLGPTLGPVIGGFLGENAGWRWVQGFLAIFTGLIWMVQVCLVPETYAPLLLRKRAQRLSKITGKVYLSKLDIQRGPVSTKDAFGAALLRPWILLAAEPIVLLLSLYMAIVYGTLYMLFDAFPIVYQEVRGWNEGVGSLPFLGVMVGMMTAVAYNIYDNKRYVRVLRANSGFAPPETRLPPTMLGGAFVPIGLFWFAWTDAKGVQFMVSIIASAPFGFGMVLVFLGVMSYLIDAYTIYAASVLAANSVIRSCFGAGFPLFTTYMYHNLGIHWATCIPAFLSLACVPFPFFFYKYGPKVRRLCKYSKESDDFMRLLAQRATAVATVSREEKEAEEEVEEAEREMQETQREVVVAPEVAAEVPESPISEKLSRTETRKEESLADLQRTRTSLAELERKETTYEENPFDVDRVHTRDSQISRVSRRSSKSRRKGFLGFKR